MRRSMTVFLCLVIVFLTSCSSPSYRFDDNDIRISLIDYWTDGKTRSYTVAVSNNGKLDVKYVNMYLYYPIITANGSKGNDFKLEGRTDGRPNHIASGQSLQFSFIAPIAEVFGASTLLDYDHPQIQFNGLVQEGKSQVSFAMSGGYLDM